MPPSLRRRAAQPPPAPAEPFSDSEDDIPEEEELDEDEVEGEVIPDDVLGIEGEEEEEDEEDEPLASPTVNLNTPPPPGLREISTLASWTVSSSKPGCSIPQLRSPSTSLFWQSDGPQPHYLNIHFFKLVRIVGLRLYLDFEADESYTPTRIIFLAGSGMNDLQEWGEMKLEQPKGWIWADFSGVGEPDSEESEDEDSGEEQDGTNEGQPSVAHADGTEHDTSDFENTVPVGRAGAGTGALDAMQIDAYGTPMPSNYAVAATQTPTTLDRPNPRQPLNTLSPTAPPQPRTPKKKKPKLPVLRAYLVQIKILENHQNGKDTHLRGLQIFARDNEKEKDRMPISKPTVLVGTDKLNGVRDAKKGNETRDKGLMRGMKRLALKESEWDLEPTIR